MSPDNEALTRAMFDGWDAIWSGIHGLLDKAGASPAIHEDASTWMETVLIPWIGQRKDVVMRDIVKDVLSLERSIARIDKVLAST